MKFPLKPSLSFDMSWRLLTHEPSTRPGIENCQAGKNDGQS